jgi:peptidoglycan/LPS O-acetylase OafA/YrhL
MNQRATPQQRPLQRLPQLEVLRVVAMTWIFLFHLWSVVPLVANSGTFGLVLMGVLHSGHLGVVVFNIITGFVLALPHLGPARRPALTYGDFLRRRFLRICPQYYLALLLWTTIMMLTAHEPSSAVVLSFVAHAFFVHTMHPTTLFGIVPAYWWLGLLAQFYLLFPLVLRLFQRLGPKRSGLVLCGICWIGWGLLTRLAVLRPGSPWEMVHYMWYFNLPARLPEFALGMWLAAAWNPGAPPISTPVPAFPRRIPLASSFAAFVLGMFLCVIVAGRLFPLIAIPLLPIYQLAWCFVGMVALCMWPPVARLGSSRIVTGVAAVSYSIYLVHQPLLGGAARWLEGKVSLPTAFGLLLVVGGAASCGLAWALDWLAARVLSAAEERPRERTAKRQ